MENISANTIKPSRTIRRRGRPCTIATQERDIQRQYGTPGSSRRQQDNHLYETRAMGQFMHDPAQRFHWLVSDQETINQRKGTIRSTILSELGRIDDPDYREALALGLCASQPSTRRAVALIRKYRLPERPFASHRQLTDALRTTLNTYLAEHAPMSWWKIRLALQMLMHDIDTNAASEASEASEALEHSLACPQKRQTQSQAVTDT